MGKLSDAEVKQIGYGVLNPSIRPSPVKTPAPDPSDGGSMRAIKQAALRIFTPNARLGTGPYRGVVLMKLPEITGEDPSELPRNSWLNNYFGDWEEGEVQEQMPYPLGAYKVYIPEIHTDLPKIKKYLPYVDGGGDDPEYRKIAMYPTFIARTSDADDAEAGDLVWVNFGNIETFEDPYYIGKVFPDPSPSPGDSNCAKDAMNGAVGDGADGGGWNGAPGEALSYTGAQKLSAKNAAEVYKKFPCSAYAPKWKQKKTCKSDPVGSKSVPPIKSYRETSQSDKPETCINCFKTWPLPHLQASSMKKNGAPHLYNKYLIKYVQKGGRGTAVSAKIGLGAAMNLPTYVERVLFAQRLVAEDQSGRPYGWGCKTHRFEKHGIDCSGFTHLSRCMVELMVSKDTNFQGLENRRFKGWNGKGARHPDFGTGEPPNSKIDLPWHTLVYGSHKGWGRVMKDNADGVYGVDYFSANGGRSGGQYEMAQRYKMGWARLLVCIDDANGVTSSRIDGDQNTTWSVGYAPVMPGDIAVTGPKSKAYDAKHLIANDKDGTNPRKVPKARPHASTHILTFFSCPGGLLRSVESGGGLGGVGTKLFHEWYTGASKKQYLTIYEPEEMGRAWSRCVSLCEAHGIPHSNGRPLVEWTPKIAKMLAPTLYKALQPDGWSEKDEENAKAAMRGDIGKNINPETGEAKGEQVKSESNPKEDEADKKTSDDTSKPENKTEGSTASADADKKRDAEKEKELEKEKKEAEGEGEKKEGEGEKKEGEGEKKEGEANPAKPIEPTSTPTKENATPEGQVGSGGSTPKGNGGAGCGAGGSGGGGGGGGGAGKAFGSGGGGSGGGGGGGGGKLAAPNPAYQGEGVPLSKPKAKKVKVRFDNNRTGTGKGKGGGLRSIREDAGNDLIGAIEVINKLGGIVSTAGVARGLGNYDPNNKNRSTTSFHYTYLAFDLYTHAASVWPSNNETQCEYVIEHMPDSPKFFRVWARSDKPSGTEFKGFKAETRTLDALVCKASGPAQVKKVTGVFIDLTKVMRSFGFQPIRARDSFMRNCKGNPMGSEWWHFQYQKGLSPGQTWEKTLTSVHSDKRYRCSPVSRHGARVFRGRGFSSKSVDKGFTPC